MQNKYMWGQFLPRLRKILWIIILIPIFNVNINASPNDTDLVMSVLIKSHGIDLRTKSLKGWIRLFDNVERLKKRKYGLTSAEVFLIRSYLLEKQNTNNLRNRRIIK